MSKIMIKEPSKPADLSGASVSQCHLAPVSLDYYSSNGTGPWYRCHECSKSCAIQTAPSTGYKWCDNCHAKGYISVANPLKLVGYDQTKLDRGDDND